MAECYRCPYTTKVERKFGVTTHCNLGITEMDVTYYCADRHKDENNSLCPFVCSGTRFPGVDYTKYETYFLSVKKETKMSNEEFREELVASVKALGKTVVENAEDFVGDGELIGDFNILLKFSIGETPEITITRSHGSKEYIKMINEKI